MRKNIEKALALIAQRAALDAEFRARVHALLDEGIRNYERDATVICARRDCRKKFLRATGHQRFCGYTCAHIVAARAYWDRQQRAERMARRERAVR